VTSVAPVRTQHETRAAFVMPLSILARDGRVCAATGAFYWAHRHPPEGCRTGCGRSEAP